MSLVQQLERRRKVVGAVVACLVVLFFISSSSSTPTSGTTSWQSSRISKGYRQTESVSLRVNETRDACQRTIDRQKHLLFDTFSQVFEGVHNIALISMPDHENKGDSVIFVAEQLVLSTLGINTQYVCGVKNCDLDELRDVVHEFGQDRFAIVFHGGGNFGDLYGREHELKMSVMNAFPHVRMHVFPQSIKFRQDDQIQHTRDILTALTHPRNSIAVRDDQSYDFAKKHFNVPNLRIDKTPDIVFFMGSRPELRRLLDESVGRKGDKSDVLFFRRKDVEGSDWQWAGGASSPDFPRTYVDRNFKKIQGKSELVVKTGDWIDWDLTEDEREGGHIQFRAWKRFMTGAEWLSSADFIVTLYRYCSGYPTLLSTTRSTPVDLGAKIASLHSRIAKERKIMEGFQAMRAATSNQDVIRTCESKMRETQKTISWFEQSLRELEGRQQHDSASSMSSYDPTTTANNGNSNINHRLNNRDLPAPPPGAAPTYLGQQQQQQYGNARSPPPSSTVGGSGLMPKPSKSKANLTSLDLIKADTPLTSAKISRMLHQLEFKLHVERQYKEGIDKMAKLYLVDGDKKARADTENKRIESRQKMVLLSQALKKYKTLDVMGELGEEEDSIPEDLRANIRKPLSGALQITIKGARDLAHAPQPKKSKHASETIIYVKVEDTPRARTHPSRNDRWNEDFEIHVDKANEVEVTIYDKVPGEGAPVPIGMLWLRLSDIVEELRRRRMETETGPGWVTAADVSSHQHQHPHGHSAGYGMGASGAGSGSGLDMPVTGGGAFGSTQMGAGSSDGIDAWFAVEPEGAMMLHLNFVKSNVRKRPYEAGGLGRQGAVRKRKEEIHEQNGHQFIQKQFYAVVMCALCGEFLLKGAGMQCEDCKYACHKNCYQKVVTKCISKSNTDDKEEDQINHRIPHRFESITNISPNWCCHCGMVLPLGRKGARKCSEPNCGITAHADCVHLVPDFCGMSMLMANQLLSDIKKIHDSKARKPHSNVKSIKSSAPSSNASSTTLTPQYQQDKPTIEGYGGSGTFEQYDGRRTPQGAYAPKPLPGRQDLAGEVGRMSLQPQQQQQQVQRVPPPAINTDSSSWAQQQQQQQQPMAPPPRGSSVPPQHQQQYLQDGRIVPAYAKPVDSQSGHFQTSPSQYLQQQQQLQQQSVQPQAGYVQSPVSTGAYPQPPVAGPAYASSTTPQAAQSQAPQPPQLGNAYQLPPLSFNEQQQQQQQKQQQQQQTQMQRQPSADIQPPQPPRMPDPRLQQQQQLPQQQQVHSQLAAQQPTLKQQQQQQLEPRRPMSMQGAPPQQQQTQQIRSARRIGLDDFNFLAVLGKGNFGKVMLAEEKRSQQLFAIKVLKKEFIIENDEVESTKSEKRVFLTAARERHPFLLGLHSCFQTETRIYFVMEYVSGGDLMLHIQREQFTPRRAKFYAAEVLLALEYFHQNGIIYRDLKLDNILLTLDGHIKVADYGLCKEDMWFGKTTSTFCGTPEFMAPEIILEQRYGRAVDWWAFGVLIYEMLLGQSPFRGDDEDEIFDAILEDEPLYPIHMPKDSVSILQKLLTRDPTRRLGAGEADAAEIKAHLFFKDTNWDDIFNKRVPAPFFPAISSATDTSNFDSEFTSEQPTLTPVHSTLSAQDQAEFAGFSWTATWAS
ncbi:Serine/threonine kinase [Microbotryomycetes sp. JL221]|nr:Serine/threonine kinase [Microbotryomycetes sp. JL221]